MNRMERELWYADERAKNPHFDGMIDDDGYVPIVDRGDPDDYEPDDEERGLFRRLLDRLIPLVRKQEAREAGKRHCRKCGCTEDDCSGCIERTGYPCHWVEYDLCSACQ